jgi:hypothetical protein
MEDKKYRQFRWQITLTKISFSVIPMLILATTLYFHFSKSYTNKVLDGLRTLVMERQSAIDFIPWGEDCSTVHPCQHQLPGPIER